ncbi:MAG TPA: hypothetical protein VN256_13150 [Pyrinomonadaceae bacterium]|nr:hypothetical protein [Pyrinomonadaceae bacterium]
MRAGELTWLTTTNVGTATTPASVKALITAGGGHADQQPLKGRINQMIDIGVDDGTINTTDIGTSTTVASLAGLTEVDTVNRPYGSVEG